MEAMTDNILQRVVEQLEEDNQCALPVQIHLFLKIHLLRHDAMSCEEFWTFKMIKVQEMVTQTVRYHSATDGDADCTISQCNRW